MSRVPEQEAWAWLDLPPPRRERLSWPVATLAIAGLAAAAWIGVILVVRALVG
jgi:hypothetical protein